MPFFTLWRWQVGFRDGKEETDLLIMGQKAKYKGKDMTEHKYVNDPWQHHEMMTQDMENNKQIRSTKFLRYLSHYKSPVDLVNNNYKKEVSKKKKK